ncbi:ATP synthase subunit I [Desulfatiglans anilini]|uniref:ATP synthase subunit I n=1 Tax=Desulfatiglans anilini TaxID=90728 RepID=UPI00042331D3|nr:ATP synthase subunit I [Desulfatiglans anilini]
MGSVDLFALAVWLLWGWVVGFFYFGGLYWTLRRLPRRSSPKIFLGLSYVIRVSVALMAFWLVLRRSFIGFLVTFVGFFIARFLVSRWVYTAIGKKSHGNQS